MLMDERACWRHIRRARSQQGELQQYLRDILRQLKEIPMTGLQAIKEEQVEHQK